MYNIRLDPRDDKLWTIYSINYNRSTSILAISMYLGLKYYIIIYKA